MGLQGEIMTTAGCCEGDPIIVQRGGHKRKCDLQLKLHGARVPLKNCALFWTLFALFFCFAKILTLLSDVFGCFYF